MFYLVLVLKSAHAVPV